MIISTNSEYHKDLISIDVEIDKLMKWRNFTKKEIIQSLRKIQSRAGEIERKTKIAGTDYFE